MTNDRGSEAKTEQEQQPLTQADDRQHLPAPSASYRRRSWVQFQRALDPLAPIKPLPPPRP
jgi:hypothetical protein